MWELRFGGWSSRRDCGTILDVASNTVIIIDERAG